MREKSLSYLVKEYEFKRKYLSNLRNKVDKLHCEYELNKDEGVKRVYEAVQEKVEDLEEELREDKKRLEEKAGTLGYVDSY